MKLSQRQLAKAASVSPATVNADIKAKADVSTVDAYVAWRRKHRESRASRRREKPAVGNPGAKSKAPSPVVLGDDWPDRVSRAREMERSSYQAYISAVQSGDVGQLERLQAAHVKSISTVADVEERALQAELGDKTIKYVDAEAVMVAVLTPLREALDKLPLNERTNCNPDHPEIAEKALMEWRDRLLIRASSAENAFKPCH